MIKYIISIILLFVVLGSSTTTTTTTPIKIDKSTSSQPCQMCKYVVNQLDHYTSNSRNIPQPESSDKLSTYMMHLIEDDCDKQNQFPQSLCKSFVQSLGYFIINSYQNNNNNNFYNNICPNICDQPSLSYPEDQPHQDKDGFDCSVCKWMVNVIEPMVESNVSTTTILQVLQHDCYNLADKSWIDICLKITSSNGNQLVRYAQQQYTPSEACQKIGRCSGSTSGSSSGGSSGSESSASSSTASTSSSGSWTGSITGGSGSSGDYYLIHP